MRLILTDAQAAALIAHALADAPREACGAIVGRDGVAARIVPIANTADDPVRHYLMEPSALARVLIGAEREGLSVIGWYHSHPDGEAIPSPADRRAATYPDTPYVIVGLRGAPAIAAWQLSAGEATPLPLMIGARSNDIETDLPQPARAMAVWLSAALAVGLLLLIAWALLPPAPPIP